MRYLTKSRFSLALQCPTKLDFADDPDYLPSMDIALRELGISRALVREANVELYEHYEARYRKQAGSIAKIRLADAFQAALRDLADLPLHRLRRRTLWDKPDLIVKVAHISQEEAASVFFSALVYTRLRRRRRRT